MGQNGVKNVIAFPVHVHCTAGILDLAFNDVITYNYAFCNLIRALRLGSCDKKSRSEHETLFLARAGRGWARDHFSRSSSESIFGTFPRSFPESILGTFPRTFLRLFSGSILGTFLKTRVYVPVIALRSKHRDTVVRMRNDPAYTNSLFLSHLAFHTNVGNFDIM